MNASEQILVELQQLRLQVNVLSANLSPFIGMDEMQSRHGVGGKTLLAMERRGEIPVRVRGKWVRTEVLEWERNHNRM
jgi:hypothetical protein